MKKLEPGEAGKLTAAKKNGGMVRMVGITGQALRRRRRHNEWFEKLGLLIEVRGQWYITPEGEQALGEYKKALNEARNRKKERRRAQRS